MTKRTFNPGISICFNEILKPIFPILGFIFLPIFLMGQVGDICSNPYLVTLRDPLVFPCDYQQISTTGLNFSSLNNNTASGANPSCNYGSANNDLWLRVQIPTNSDGFNLSINDAIGSSNDYRNFSAALYSGTSCSNLVYQSCQRGSAANFFRFYDGLPSSSNYYVRIFSDNTPAGTYLDPFYIQMAAINTITSNDACENARPLVANTYCNNTATGKNEPQPKAPDNITGTGIACVGFGSYENNQWYAFSVGPSTVQPVVVSLTGINCTGTNQILQAALWKSTTYNCANWANGSNLSNVSAANDGDLIACSLGSGALNISKTLPIGNYWFTVDGSRGSFCTYTVNASPTLLPVKFLEFGGKIDGNYIELQWTCLQVYNVKEFVIEKSNNGKDFTSVNSIIPSSNGSISTFSFIDSFLESSYSQNYYRIKSVEITGEISFSKIILIKPSVEPATISIESIDVKNQWLSLTSSFKEPTIVNIKITDTAGKELTTIQKNLNPGITEVSLSGLFIANGIYLINLQAENFTKSAKVAFCE